MHKKRLDPLVQAHRDGAVFPTIRHAYYVASSAVTSAAINDMPDLASIRRNGAQFGSVSYRADADHRSLAVVRFSGLAGVHLLTRTNVTIELSLACGEACLPAPERTPRHRGRDSIAAVCEILRVEPNLEGLALFDRANEYFGATRAVVGSLWPCVQAVVDALLERQTLSRSDLMRTIGPFQIYQPAFATLERYGVLPKQ